MPTEIPHFETDLWCVDNAVDRAAEIFATSQVGALGPLNVRDPRRSKPWRMGDNGATLTIRFPAPVTLDVIALWGTVASEATVQVAMGTTHGGSEAGSFVWRPDLAPGAEQAVLVWGVATALAAGQVAAGPWVDATLETVADATAPFVGPAYNDPGPEPTMTGSSNVALTTVPGVSTLTADLGPAPQVIELRLTVSGIRDVGRVWAGPVFWRPSVPHRTGAGQEVEDTSLVQRNPRDGGVFIDRGRRLRRQNVTYDMLTAEEYDGAAYALAMVSGTSRQLLFVPNPNLYRPTLHALLCRQEEVHPIVASGWRRWERSYALREDG